jgi:thiol-disulfide isomerase/thioredoxin
MVEKPYTRKWHSLLQTCKKITIIELKYTNRLMKKFFSVLTLTIIAMTLTSGQEGDGSLLKVGDKAPQFTATTIDGKVVDLKAVKDKVVMVTFFATWCGPCNLELPVLEKNVWNKYKDRNDFVLVVLGREHDEKVLKEFAASKKLNLPLRP